MTENLPTIQGVDWAFVLKSAVFIVPLVNAVKKWFKLEGNQSLIAVIGISAAIVFGNQLGVWNYLLHTPFFGSVVMIALIAASASGSWETVKSFITKLGGA